MCSVYYQNKCTASVYITVSGLQGYSAKYDRDANGHIILAKKAIRSTEGSQGVSYM